MGPRPANLNLNDGAGMPQPPRMNLHVDLPSPRTGEVPPALSPLDAFALQSRILAKKFEQEAQNGRRISRLPNTVVAKELANRPDYFRSVSGGSDASAMSEVPEVQEEEARPTTRNGLTVAGGEEYARPLSHYPMFGHARNRSDRSPAQTPYFDAEEVVNTTEAQDYFGIGIPRSSSPEPTDPMLKVASPLPMVPSLTNSIDSVSSTSHPRTWTTSSTRSLKSDRGLAPPKSPAHLQSVRSIQSIRSVKQDSGDEDAYLPFNTTSAVPSSRKFSSSSNMSRPQSPFSPYMPPRNRSPSMTSELSMNGSQILQQARSQVNNFSRPMSSSGRSIDTRPSIDSRASLEMQKSNDLPLRHASASSNSTHPSSFSANASRQNSAENVNTMTYIQTPSATEYIETPGDADGADYFASRDGAAPSYTYAKYDLPRGRPVERESISKRTSWLPPQFSREEEKPVPAAPTAEKTSLHHRQESDNTNIFTRKPREASPAGSDRISGIRLSSRDLSATSANRSRSAGPRPAERSPLHRATPSMQSPRSPLHRSTASVQSESTDRTIKAIPLHERNPSAELTADEHLEIGIQAHTAGQLNKSTYHLRLAAQAGLPTAMLLYALACRHGWGMRANQEDGVMWLRKAIEGSGLEVVDVEEQVSSASRSPKSDPVAEAAERKKRKAQFALAIYELGISYMNGWGCPKDKALALRCYEVAGNWGDCDALAEAGFCYTQGVGCKKDLKKAAALYRVAAEGGMSMAGNSWIYKAKYMDDAASTRPTTRGRKRSDAAKPTEDAQKPGRSRARSLWGRRKDRQGA